MARAPRKAKAKAAIKASPQRQTRARSKLASAQPLMTGLDDRGKAKEALPETFATIAQVETYEQDFGQRMTKTQDTVTDVRVDQQVRKEEGKVQEEMDVNAQEQGNNVQTETRVEDVQIKENERLEAGAQGLAELTPASNDERETVVVKGNDERETVVVKGNDDATPPPAHPTVPAQLSLAHLSNPLSESLDDTLNTPTSPIDEDFPWRPANPSPLSQVLNRSELFGSSSSNLSSVKNRSRTAFSGSSTTSTSDKVYYVRSGADRTSQSPDMIMPVSADQAKLLEQVSKTGIPSECDCRTPGLCGVCEDGWLEVADFRAAWEPLAESLASPAVLYSSAVVAKGEEPIPAEQNESRGCGPPMRYKRIWEGPGQHDTIASVSIHLAKMLHDFDRSGIPTKCPCSTPGLCFDCELDWLYVKEFRSMWEPVLNSVGERPEETSFGVPSRVAADSDSVASKEGLWPITCKEKLNRLIPEDHSVDLEHRWSSVCEPVSRHVADKVLRFCKTMSVPFNCPCSPYTLCKSCEEEWDATTNLSISYKPMDSKAVVSDDDEPWLSSALKASILYVRKRAAAKGASTSAAEEYNSARSNLRRGHFGIDYYRRIWSSRLPELSGGVANTVTYTTIPGVAYSGNPDSRLRHACAPMAAMLDHYEKNGIPTECHCGPPGLCGGCEDELKEVDEFLATFEPAHRRAQREATNTKRIREPRQDDIADVHPRKKLRMSSIDGERSHGAARYDEESDSDHDRDGKWFAKTDFKDGRGRRNERSKSHKFEGLYPQMVFFVENAMRLAEASLVEATSSSTENLDEESTSAAPATSIIGSPAGTSLVKDDSSSTVAVDEGGDAKKLSTNTLGCFGSGGDSTVTLPAASRYERHSRRDFPELDEIRPNRGMNVFFLPKKPAEYVPDHDRCDVYDIGRTTQSVETLACCVWGSRGPWNDVEAQEEPDEQGRPRSLCQESVGCSTHQTGAEGLAMDCSACKLRLNRRWDEAVSRNAGERSEGTGHTITQDPRIMDLEGPDVGCWDARSAVDVSQIPQGSEDEEDSTDWETEQPGYEY